MVARRGRIMEEEANGGGGGGKGGKRGREGEGC